MKNEAIVLDENQRRITKDAEGLPAMYAELKIESATEYEGAVARLKDIKVMAREIEAMRKSMTKPIDESKRRIMDFFRNPAEALKKAEALIKSAMLQFSSEQERIRQAEESRLREAQRKEALRLENLAAKARERDDEEKAAEFDKRQADVESTQVFAAPVAAPKVMGVSTREIWTFEITDKDLIPREYMVPDLKTIGDMVRATKGKVPVPGVRIFSRQTLAAGR